MRLPELSSSTAMSASPQSSRGVPDVSHPLHLEILECRPCPRETLPVCPKGPSPCCPDVYPLQARDHSTFRRPFAIRVHSDRNTEDAILICSTLFWSTWRSQILCSFSSTFNTASSAHAEADGHGHQSCHHPLAVQLPDRHATTCRDQAVVYVGGVIWGPHQTLVPFKDVCCPLRCSCCTLGTASVLPKPHFRLSSWTTRHWGGSSLRVKTHTAVPWRSLWAGARTTTSFSTSPRPRR